MTGKNKKVEISFSSKGTKKCPYCQKEVEPEAVTCPYCHGNFVSTNRFKNAIGIVLCFLILYWLISSFASCETEHEMKKIEEQAEREVERLGKQVEMQMKKNGF